MSPQPDSTTPPGFPRDQFVGSVSGVQPKLLVRKIGNAYVHGLTEDELYARYDACVDMVEQLAAYCHKKLKSRPDWPPEELLNKVRTAIVGRADWDFSAGEVKWMMAQLAKEMEWPRSAES